MNGEISADQLDDVHRLLAFLTHWLAYHILGADQNMARQIKKIELGTTPDEAFVQENDTCGHDAGDDVLRHLSRALKGAGRTDDIVCRLGGDEFLIICPDTDLEGGLYVAGMVCDRVAALSVPTGQGAWTGSISVGVSVRTSGMDDFDALVKAADGGVYEAKGAGKGCVRTVHAGSSECRKTEA